MGPSHAPIKHAVILAAGRGQRMMPLTESVPKPMAPYAGSTLIAQGIDRVRRFVPSVHVTVGYKGAMLAQHVVEHGAASIHNTDGRDNAWWMFHTLLSYLDEPIVVLTCDNVVELDFDRLEHDYRSAGSPPCMLVPVEPIAGLEGDYIFHDRGVVTRLDRHAAAPIYASGIQVLNPRAVAAATDGVTDFNRVWDQLIAERLLFVSSVYPKQWISIDTVGQLEALNRRHAEAGNGPKGSP